MLSILSKFPISFDTSDISGNFGAQDVCGVFKICGIFDTSNLSGIYDTSDNCGICGPFDSRAYDISGILGNFDIFGLLDDSFDDISKTF